MTHCLRLSLWRSPDKELQRNHCLHPSTWAVSLPSAFRRVPLSFPSATKPSQRARDPPLVLCPRSPRPLAVDYSQGSQCEGGQDHSCPTGVLRGDRQRRFRRLPPIAKCGMSVSSASADRGGSGRGEGCAEHIFLRPAMFLRKGAAILHIEACVCVARMRKTT